MLHLANFCYVSLYNAVCWFGVSLRSIKDESVENNE